MADWHRDHAVERQAYRIAWEAENREWRAAWNARNAESRRQQKAASQRRRRDRTRSSVVIRDSDLRSIVRRQSGRCAYCRQLVADSARSWDHVIPLSRGGRDALGNLLMACLKCNQQKHAKTVMEWRVSRRRLGMADLQSLTVL